MVGFLFVCFQAVFLSVALAVSEVALYVDQDGLRIRDASASFMLLPPPSGYSPVFIDAKSKGCDSWVEKAGLSSP